MKISKETIEHLKTIKSEIHSNFGSESIVMNELGNFELSDPNNGGNGELRYYNGTYEDWCNKHRISYGKFKGKIALDVYCEFYVEKD